MAINMDHSSDSEPQIRRNVRKRAQQWVTRGALVHEDSDDELGVEDHPWEWIYDTATEIKEETDGVRVSPEKPGRRRASRSARKRPTIVGARMGTFECRLGQVVLLKSPEPGKDWVGIITEFVEEEDEDEEDEMIKSANIMWFASPDEFLSTRNKRRADALPNEQYLTADFNVNPLTSINGRATVMSKDAFYTKYPNGAPPKDKAELAEYSKCIVCRRGVSQVQGRYTEEFVWEEVYNEDNIFHLINIIKDGLKAAKKRKVVDSDVSNPSHLTCAFDSDQATMQYVDSKEESAAPTTPRKRQRLAGRGTPQSQRKKALTTPTHKRYVDCILAHWNYKLMSDAGSWLRSLSNLHPWARVFSPQLILPRHIARLVTYCMYRRCQSLCPAARRSSIWSTTISARPSWRAQVLVSTSPALLVLAKQRQCEKSSRN